MWYRIFVHTGPISNKNANELLAKMRAYVGPIVARNRLFGTETMYFEVTADDDIGAKLLAAKYLQEVFGSSTGFVSGIKFAMELVS